MSVDVKMIYLLMDCETFNSLLRTGQKCIQEPFKNLGWTFCKNSEQR